MIDFIGDIHGHADQLVELLWKLGYRKSNGTYSHPKRKVVFVGDYIDRGPKIRETLEIVKSMVDTKNAIALMGNHEYNALCFHFTEKEGGGHLRKHKIKNIIQHYETLKQFQNKQQEYEEYLDWFQTLPLFYETEQFKAVHACWDTSSIAYLKEKLVNGKLTDSLIYESAKEDTELNSAIELVLKGKEMKIPAGLFFSDKDGTKRTEMRIKWWENPSKMTYKSISVESIQELPEQPIDLSELKSLDFYSDNSIVFFGHYWLKGAPSLYKNNICCLDYSVAKGGKLVAYQFNGEDVLHEKNFISV